MFTDCSLREARHTTRPHSEALQIDCHTRDRFEPFRPATRLCGVYALLHLDCILQYFKFRGQGILNANLVEVCPVYEG